MLTATEFQTLRGATGVPVTWSQAKAPNATRNLQAVTGPVDQKNEVLVNAYGVGGRVFQVLAGDLPVAPEKFDTFQLQTARFVVEDVTVQHARNSGTVVSYRCFCKGK